MFLWGVTFQHMTAVHPLDDLRYPLLPDKPPRVESLQTKALMPLWFCGQLGLAARLCCLVGPLVSGNHTAHGTGLLWRLEELEHRTWAPPAHAVSPPPRCGRLHVASSASLSTWPPSPEERLGYHLEDQGSPSMLLEAKWEAPDRLGEPERACTGLSHGGQEG